MRTRASFHPTPLRRWKRLGKVRSPSGLAGRQGYLGIFCDEGHYRAFGPAQSAGARPSHRRAAQHHSDPRQCADRGRGRQIGAEEHRPRPRGVRAGRRRRRPDWLDDRTCPRDLRHRAQTPGWSAGEPRDDRRRGTALLALWPVAIHPSGPAGFRFSRPDLGRVQPSILASRGRTQASDRKHPVRDLDRGDALLSERHFPPYRRRRRGADAARGRDRRPSAGAGRNAGAARGRSGCPASSPRARR